MKELTVTLEDENLCGTLETEAANSGRTMQELVVEALQLWLNESELEAIFAAAADAGAREAGYILLRLPLEIKDMFEEWLRLHAPQRARHVMSRMRDMHAGQHYRSGFGLRQTGSGPSAELLAQRFRLARKKYGMDNPALRLDVSRFCPPPRSGDQLTLL